jgi:hypothetical protein
MEMWEILVPTIRRSDGKPLTTRFHRVWDKKVYEITGGMTILTPTRGKWISRDGDLFEERMIPVRIACNKEQIEKIIKMTADYYDQLAILAYKVSTEVYLYERN